MFPDEAAFQAAVLEVAKTWGLRVAHFRKAKTPRGNWITPVGADGKGFPDLLICGKRGVLYRELKSSSGRLSEEQKMWGLWLHRAGADWGVWTPAQWPDQIKIELNAIR